MTLARSAGLLLALGVLAWGQTAEEDFFLDVTEAAPAPSADHQAALLEQPSWRLGGVLRATLEPIWTWPSWSDVGAVRPDDAIRIVLQTDLFADARPDRDTRVFVRTRLSWPYRTASDVRLFELFADLRPLDFLAFRLGKQVLSWGYSRFFQIADVFSLEPKDPADPAAELEGPIALKAVWTLDDTFQAEGVAFAKPTFLPEGQPPRAEHLGYTLRLRALLPWGGEVTTGGFFQTDLSPRVVLGWTSAVPGLNLQVFSDTVFSYGSDQRFLKGDWPFLTTAKRSDEWFTSLTLGARYRNSDWRLTLYAEYLFNSAGSDRSDYLSDLLALYGIEQFLPPAQRTLTPDDFRYRYRHNFGGFVQWSDLFEVQRLELSLLGLFNPIEPSALAEPSLSWGVTSQITLQAGARLAWGKDGTEFVTRQQGSRLTAFVQARIVALPF